MRRRYIPLPEEVIYEYLGEDEYVIHYDHPSLPAFLVNNMALVVLIPIVGPIFVAFFTTQGLNWTTITIFLILDVIVAILALRRLSYRYTTYVISNLRLIRVAGILSRKVNSIPWTRMTGLGFEQSATGRVLGYATIRVESANEESGLDKFSDIADPAEFHMHLLNMVAAKSGQSAPTEQPPTPTRGERRSFFKKRRERRAQVSRMAQHAQTAPDTLRQPPPPPQRRRQDTPTGPPATEVVASTVGGWAAAAKSAVREGLQWPGSTEPGDEEAAPTGEETAAQEQGQVAPGSEEQAPGVPPPPPSPRPPYRRRPDQRAPSKPETIVIPTTSRRSPQRGPRGPQRRGGPSTELPETPGSDETDDSSPDDD